MSDTTEEFDEVAARALAAIILERTAAVVEADNDVAAVELQGLSDDTMLALDVCAAILFATSALAGIGSVPAVAIFAAAQALEPDDVDTDTEVPDAAGS